MSGVETLTWLMLLMRAHGETNRSSMPSSGPADADDVLSRWARSAPTLVDWDRRKAADKVEYGNPNPADANDARARRD